MTTEEIWIKYKENQDKALKDLLIVNYIPLVKIVAGRMYNFYGSKVEFDDLLGYGILGLIDSIEKFDISKNIKFETYAQIRIKGSMIDNIRKLDWIPRSLRKKSKQVQQSMQELENKLGYIPSNTELANHMNISVNEVENIFSDIATFNVISLEEFLKNKSEGILDSKGNTDLPDNLYEKKEIECILIESINDLPEKEKLIISLYYYDELTYKEIGSILDLSESRISQIHSKIMLKLKNHFKKEGIDDH